jgi:hypothetical protein
MSEILRDRQLCDLIERIEGALDVLCGRNLFDLDLTWDEVDNIVDALRAAADYLLDLRERQHAAAAAEPAA